MPGRRMGFGLVAVLACASLAAMPPAPAHGLTQAQKQRVAKRKAAAKRRAMKRREVTKLLHQGCPRNYTVRRRDSFNAATVADAKQGYFTLNGVRRYLRPRVDWHQDPIHSRTYRYTLQGFYWITPLIYAYEHNQDILALHRARDLALDWSRHNSPRSRHTQKEAWVDKIVGDRAGVLGFITRASACRHILSRHQARVLLNTLNFHGRYLYNNHHYAQHTNHGLFEDYGLVLTKGYFPYMIGSKRWHKRAAGRFAKHIRHQMTRHGVWVEHSSVYQLVAYRLVSDFLAAAQRPVGFHLTGRKHQLRTAAAWLVEPNNRMVPWGDTDYSTNGAELVSAERTGMSNLLDGGWAMVRNGQNWLGATASYFSGTHKHQDDLSFDLYGSGQRLISDSARSSNDANDPWRSFTVHPQAHSVLTVDGNGFRGKPYRTGLFGEASDNGWYAIAGRNPRLKAAGVNHTRLWLYQPGHYLVIVDRVRSNAVHTYRRYFQWGENVSVSADGPDAMDLSAPGFTGHWDDNTGATLDLRRGADNPMFGWYFPSFRQRQPRYTLVARNQARNINAVSVINLANGHTVAATLQNPGTTIKVQLDQSGLAGPVSLTTTFHENFSGPITLSASG